jgi:hypothetical protein
MQGNFRTYIEKSGTVYALALRRDTPLSRVSRVNRNNVETFLDFTYSVIDSVHKTSEERIEAKRNLLGYLARKSRTPEMVEYFVEERGKLKAPRIYDVPIGSDLTQGLVE